MLDAPNARSLGFTADRSQVAWSEDGRRVALTNTFLSGSKAQVPCAAAVVDLKTLKADCLYFEDGGRTADVPRLHDVAFGKEGRRSTSFFEELVASSLIVGSWFLLRARSLQRTPRSEQDSLPLSCSFTKASTILRLSGRRIRPADSGRCGIRILNWVRCSSVKQVPTHGRTQTVAIDRASW